MSVPILVCECGLRVKARGATPGRVGRCPSCGSPLKVPDLQAPKNVKLKQQRGAAETGYRLEPEYEASVRVPLRPQSASDLAPRNVFAERKTPTPMADGLLPVLERPETSWLRSFSYPLRGAESLGMVAATSAVFWILTVLVPEYCLGVIGDTNSMGVPTLGHFIALISILPVIILLPIAILYWLQYLGRVLVSSAMGETSPPRTPDRNFDGFFTGISPWLIWLALGVFVGMLPLLFYGFRSSAPERSTVMSIGLLLLGGPYVLMALMMTFLHDDAFGATPWNVIGAMFRLGGSFGLLCLFIATTFALPLALVAGALLLRDKYIWIYVIVALACWVVMQWTSIVQMRILGTYYFSHRDRLRWHREHPRWGVAWRL
jgi:hypothetical protein